MGGVLARARGAGARGRCSAPALAAPPRRAAPGPGATPPPSPPPPPSIHEEATISVVQPFMAVFNNLVMFDQEKSNSLDTIVPDLAESWSWNADQKQAHLQAAQGVKWHDGKPFTAKDVEVHLDLLIGKADEKPTLPQEPAQGLVHNLKDVTAQRRHEVTFNLGRPQPSFLSLLASGYTPVYPCHVSPRHAHQADRHRAVQVRRVQAQRGDQARAQSRLLEEGPALSRRHRMEDHRPTARRASWPSSPASST